MKMIYRQICDRFYNYGIESASCDNALIIHIVLGEQLQVDILLLSSKFPLELFFWIIETSCFLEFEILFKCIRIHRHVMRNNTDSYAERLQKIPKNFQRK